MEGNVSQPVHLEQRTRNNCRPDKTCAVELSRSETQDMKRKSDTPCHAMPHVNRYAIRSFSGLALFGMALLALILQRKCAIGMRVGNLSISIEMGSSSCLQLWSAIWMTSHSFAIYSSNNPVLLLIIYIIFHGGGDPQSGLFVLD